METNGTAKETNLPEEGVQNVNNEEVNSEINQELTGETEANLLEEPEEPVAENAIEEKVEAVSENAELQKEEVTETTEALESVEAEKVEETLTEGETAEEELENEVEKGEEEVKAEPEPESDKLDGATENDTEKKSEVKSFTPEDYSSFDKTVLLTKLNTLINNYEVIVIRDAVEEIKTVFYKQYKAEVAEAKKEYIDNGGVPEDFKYADESSEETFKVLYGQYKEKKAVLNQQLEKEKTTNLRTKYQIIEEINELINNEESINKTFQDFRDLQQRWREVGLVPQNAVKGLWDSYNHTVEKFYDFININKELRDLDLRKNLELKIELCEKAESLLLEDSVTKAFKTLQEYHNKWREIGPVPREQKDEIWDRFKAATTQINKKHQDYFEGLKDQQIKNLEQKTALCERVEEIIKVDMDKPRGWEDKAKELIEIQKLWRTIGFAPKKDNNKIYQRFKAACDDFFAHKREFYKAAKEVQKNHLQLKLDLCVQAEALKDSTEWKKTTEDFIKLQKRWKEIGPVPKKHSEILWKRFRTACDFFFDKKSDFFNTVDTRQEDNLKLKLELIDKVKNFKKGKEDKDSLKQLMEIQKEWADVGHVPLSKKDEIHKNFRDAIDEQFEKLKIDISERNKLNYKTKVDNWVNSHSRNKIYSERNKLVVKIKELESEIALYENNIGFFSASSNSQSLLADVARKIEKAKERMVALKQKLNLLDKAEDTL